MISFLPNSEIGMGSTHFLVAKFHETNCPHYFIKEISDSGLRMKLSVIFTARDAKPVRSCVILALFTVI
jgi:hypothetical protein